MARRFGFEITPLDADLRIYVSSPAFSGDEVSFDLPTEPVFGMSDTDGGVERDLLRGDIGSSDIPCVSRLVDQDVAWTFWFSDPPSGVYNFAGISVYALEPTRDGDFDGGTPFSAYEVRRRFLYDNDGVISEVYSDDHLSATEATSKGQVNFDEVPFELSVFSYSVFWTDFIKTRENAP